MNRAYSLLHVKSIDDGAEFVTIHGMASTPTPDRLGDVIEPKGATFADELPLLWQHRSDQPIGHARLQKGTAKGIPFTAKLPIIKEPGALKTRVDEAIHSLRYRLIGAVSIGFDVLNNAVERLADGGLRFIETEILELSLVTIPANAEATISYVKTLDERIRAASGRRSHSRPASGHQTKGQREMNPKNIDDQVSELEETRDQLRTEMLSFGDVTDLDGEQSTQYDTVCKSFEENQTKLERAQRLQNALRASRSVSDDHRGAPALAIARRTERNAKELPKGTLFTRYAMAVAAGKGSISDTLEYAKRWKSSTPEIIQHIKAVAGTTLTDSGEWGSQLVYAQNLASEFIELLMPRTVIGRVQGFDRVPFNVRIVEQLSGSTVNWVGERAAKPVGELEFGEFTLGYHKIAGIVVLSDELIRLSTPSAEVKVREDLVKQIAKFMDEQFLDDSVTATATRPAAITQGVVASSASGTDAEALRADLNVALATFDSAEIDGDLVMVMPKALARGISLLQNALGQSEFPQMTPNGGTLIGIPVLVSNSAPSGTITIFAPSEIALADDGAVTLDASNQATLDMAGGTAPDFSLWQRNCTAVRAERWITYKKKRAASVAVIDTAAYGPAVASP